ncbi:YggS family pyridoxal phosphate-dependent enzyme [bacterium]|nr:YggS family pyridoxal phosphate-dependent enzyme [candidate division CSSED10-310 bacterium]
MLIADNLRQVEDNICIATASAGRNRDEIRLVAISKSHPAESVREAVESGHILFGENRIQEAVVKIRQLADHIRWHFVGHLQSNKAKTAVRYFDLIHSVDSIPLLREIDRRAADIGKIQPILLQINISGESSKSGIDPDRIECLLEAVETHRNIQLMGWMTIPPLFGDPEKSRPYFVRLREISERFAGSIHGTIELSMGMSNDYMVAIEEGATLIRVGTAIFGAR